MALLVLLSLPWPRTPCPPPHPASSLQSYSDPLFQADGDFIVGESFPLHYRAELSDQKAAAGCRRLDARCYPWALMCPVINITLCHLNCVPACQRIHPVTAKQDLIAESLLITLILYHTQMAKLVFKQII
ncbi:hypothetical protein SKAU_G00078240 [Synaphobranchus kaupii]|uniref:Uncharacterized protein n=1 Tax=Synaphobranchus kaupii TaxID=118154 RepID=A0A9Q1FUC5_SYNKA|nr:hypothetical protein SKAU_G00078240 [Synaphobranchus kaupii]